MAGNSLIFKDAEKARDAIMESQKKEIQKLYEDWSKEIMHKSSKYKLTVNPSDAVKQTQLKELRKMLRETSEALANEVNNKIKQGIYEVSDLVVGSNKEWMKKLGFDFPGLDAAFSSVPDSIVRKLVTGQIYESGWSLSKRIWGDNEQTLKELYTIVAGGVAKNESVYDIAKKLEKYVSPSAAKQWNLTDKDGRKIYPKKVDYNAQRLARTLMQHSYQQSFIETTKNNPFITDYIWNSNGPRVCDICKARDGKHFKKDELPMDHPNGMCVMVPNVTKDLEKKIADWVNGLDGTYPEIDEFAKSLGYIPQKPTLEDITKKYGNSTNKVYASWLSNLPSGIKAQVAEYKNISGLKWQDFYEQNFKANAINVASNEIKTLEGIFDKLPNTFFDGVNSFDMLTQKLASDTVEKYINFVTFKLKSNMSNEDIYKVFEAYKSKANKTIVGGTKEVTDISSWIENVKKNTKSEMLEKEELWMLQIGEDGKKAITTYTGPHYTEMNGYLRRLARGESEYEARENSYITQALIDKIDTAKKSLGNVLTDRDYYVRRGTRLGEISGLFMEGDFDDNLSAIGKLSVEELNNKFQGAIGKYAGFTSTSSIWSRGFSGEVEVIIKVPKGTHASSIMSISEFGTGEGEFLLNAGTNVKCINIEKSDGHKNSIIRMFLEVI